MKKLSLLLAVLFVFAAAGLAVAEDYNFISPDDMNESLKAGQSQIIVDICVPEQFAKGHIKGSVETNAYPVKTDEERARLDNVLPTIEASKDRVVIVCPRGGGGAKRTYDHYKSKGVDEKRLFILEKGMDGWPYESVPK